MTVRVMTYEPDEEVVPHAIFWRPLRYFTLVVRESQDDLDSYQGASFVIGNDIRFDLRVYRGHLHPEVTVTLYLPEDVDPQKISETVSTVIEEMDIPISAVAWRRGNTFKFGQLNRNPDDRLRESEARLLILKIAASQPERSASISQLHREIPKFFDLSPIDESPSPSRKNERRWQIVVRNTTSSHTRGARTIFAQGWAKKIPGGLTVTNDGINYLNSIGFLDTPDRSFNDDE